MLRHLIWPCGVFLALTIALLAGASGWMMWRYQSWMQVQPEQLRPMPMALVLGTSVWSAGGEPSIHFAGRMQAAAELYHSGRVQTLLLSGANPTRYYNEPQRMREAMLKHGVPDSALVLDYAGRRTLDSVRRARDVFHAQEIIIVSQAYHLYRALFLADADGLSAQGLIAPGPSLRQRWRTEWREVLARVLAVLDIYLLDTQPHFPVQPSETSMARKHGGLDRSE
nr:YdcF family protein [Oceanococcus sp. HetDA_MAG_MS8]